MKFKGIIVLMTSNGDNESPYKIYFWTLSSFWLCDKYCSRLGIFWTSLSTLISKFSVSCFSFRTVNKFFLLVILSSVFVNRCMVSYSCLLLRCGFLSVLQVEILRFQASNALSLSLLLLFYSFENFPSPALADSFPLVASLHKSPRLFLVFQPITIMLWFG